VSPYLKKSKMTGGMAQEVEHLPSKCKALNSIPKTTCPPQKKKTPKNKIKYRVARLLGMNDIKAIFWDPLKGRILRKFM
jgi:hypothetical protein